MGIRKTDRHIAREVIAQALNQSLPIELPLTVSANCRNGPYCVTITSLNERQLRIVLAHLQEWLPTVPGP